KWIACGMKQKPATPNHNDAYGIQFNRISHCSLLYFTHLGNFHTAAAENTFPVCIRLYLFKSFSGSCRIYNLVLFCWIFQPAVSDYF
ncbi:MAG: hypothetical protein WAN36_10575, partial [Calditrichia bacterium]